MYRKRLLALVIQHVEPAATLPVHMRCNDMRGKPLKWACDSATGNQIGVVRIVADTTYGGRHLQAPETVYDQRLVRYHRYPEQQPASHETVVSFTSPFLNRFPFAYLSFFLQNPTSLPGCLLTAAQEESVQHQNE